MKCTLLVVILTLLYGIAVPAVSQSQRDAIASLIGLTTVAEQPGRASSGRLLMAPNGQSAVFITSRGLLQENKIESSLWLVSIHEVEKYRSRSSTMKTAKFQPSLLARLRAVPRREADDTRQPIIHDVQWLADSSALVFRAEDGFAHHRLYESVVASRTVQLLSHTDEDVKAFDIAGKTLIYSEVDGRTDLNRTNPIPRDVTGMSLPDILFPGDSVAFGTGLKRIRLHLVALNKKRQRESTVASREEPLDHDQLNDALSLSPDGHTVIRTLPIQQMEAAWEQYLPPSGYENWALRSTDMKSVSPSNRYRLRRYVLTNTRTGITVPLLTSPIGLGLNDGDAIAAVWSRDGKRILAGNVTLPLSASEEEHKQRRHICAVAAIEYPSLRADCIVYSRDASTSKAASQHGERWRVSTFRFGKDDDEVLLELSSPRSEKTELYRHETDRWSIAPKVSRSDNIDHVLRLSLTPSDSIQICEDINTPPYLCLLDAATGLRSELWNPNPRYRSENYPRAEPLHWTDATGYQWSGFLLRPASWNQSKQYPLVIQTHGASPSRFLIDGKYPTAEAARALASEGFVVLQIPYRSDHIGTMQEPEDQIEGYEGAISLLARRGLIDPKRVGIVAFSRTGFHVEHALIERPKMFAAAVIADASDYSYMPYRLFGQGDDFVSKNILGTIGTKPYGEGLTKWGERAADFHMDKVTVPTLIQALGPPSVLLEWELYTSLRDAGDPTDLLYLPEGQHLLQMPRDLYASQHATIDWFRRWLVPEVGSPAIKK